MMMTMVDRVLPVSPIYILSLSDETSLFPSIDHRQVHVLLRQHLETYRSMRLMILNQGLDVPLE